MLWRAFVLLVAPAAAFSTPRLPSIATRAMPRLALRLTESSAPSAEDDKELISFASLSKDYQTVVLAALEQRNKLRILSGQPTYMEFEGNNRGISVAEAEDEVVRFLQRQALLDEGGLEGDPQEVVTFVLLALLVGGIGYSLVFGDGVQPV